VSNFHLILQMEITQEIPFHEREDWKDIVPIPQDDGENPLVPIAYSSYYQSAMDYFRAIIKKGEKSPRAMNLTTELIFMNPSHYSIWEYRKKIIIEMKHDLNQELDFLDELAIDHPKSYQLWHHRRSLVEFYRYFDREIPFINAALKEDAKNFHAWAYRQWVVKTCALWKEEMLYLTQSILADVRNNSAWNQRYFVLTQNPDEVTSDVLSKEIQFTLDAIKLAPNNESPWNYLLAIVKKYDSSRLKNLLQFCEGMLQDGCRSSHLLYAMLDIYEAQLKDGDSQILAKHQNICEQLAIEVDPIRRNYVVFRRKLIEKNYAV